MSDRIAYVMSRFPTITETFVLFEMIELGRLGTEISIHPLVLERTGTHPEARALMGRVRHVPPLSPASLRAAAAWLARDPRRYVSTWGRVLKGNARSPGFLVRSVAVMLQSGVYARQMQQAGVRRVHAHFATHPALAAWAIRRLTGIPYSITAHAHDIFVDRSMLDEKIRDASFVVTISDFNKEMLAGLYGPAADAKTSVIHCGVDLGVFDFRPRPQPGDPFTILCVASLRDYKGHRFLIEACAILRDRRLGFRCLLVGEGEDRAALEALVARHGLGGHVQLLGARPRDEVRDLMRQADAMVLASVTTPTGKMDGIPVALMEALATGTPAIATRLSGIPELIRHERTGLLVDEADPGAIADAVTRFMNEPDLRATVAAGGRALVEREYDLAGCAATLHRLLEQ